MRIIRLLYQTKKWTREIRIAEQKGEFVGEFLLFSFILFLTDVWFFHQLLEVYSSQGPKPLVCSMAGPSNVVTTYMGFLAPMGRVLFFLTKQAINGLLAEYGGA